MLNCRNIWKIFGRAPEKAYRALAAGNNASTHDAQGHVVAVRAVSFDVARGETFVVMGLSGSGKSTLVRCLARLTDPTAGEVIVDGRDLIKMPEAELRELRRHKLSMVFQNFGLLPHRRVLDNVAYGLEVRGDAKAPRTERAMQMIELVGLKGWEQRYPRELSGGMQQRVGLARALAVNPEILFFDEPFSALDPLIRREMQDELLRLQSQLHKTSIFITHDFAEALKLGDHIAIMKQGTIVQVGTPQELVLHPADDYVAAFVADAPRAKVLTAAAVMAPCPAGFVLDGNPTCQSNAPLESLLPVLAATETPVVALSTEGKPAGLVNRSAVLEALSATPDT
jgi:glycine betaine/proline transport system ATP-binding protein